MKLNEYREASRAFTKTASEIVRQLCLAGIAVIWIFKEPYGSKHIIDPLLVFPLFFLVISLFCDLLQNLIGGKIWIDFYKQKEQEYRNAADPNPDIKAPKGTANPIYYFYYGKIVTMILAYVFIVIHFITLL